MAYPAVSPSNGSDAQSLLVNKALAAGLSEPSGGLNFQDMLGAAVGNMFTDSPPAASVLTSSSIKSSSAALGVGYATGAGGAVTQATNRSTTAVLSKIAGQVTTNTTSLAAAAQATFTVTNTAVAATDVILLSIASGQTNKETKAYVSAVAAGSFDITVHNQHASTAEVGAIVINFAVIKAVAA